MRVVSSPGFARPRPCAAWDDEALARALRDDNETAFAELYERYWQRLYATAHRKLGSGADAEEIVQDVFVTLWHRRATVDIEQLEAYLFSAVRYKIIDCVRARLARLAYATQAAARPPGPDYGTEESVGVTDLSAALAASVRCLPDSAREVFQLSREGHWSVPEIAVQLNLAPKTVEHHLTRALRLLRGHLKDFLLLVLVLGDVLK